ncbi:metallophosphoesterase family protein [Actinomadura madurae]|uniref:metallophosphoesterase family protein n=1 Tax=Actinomadura madurae TaxID=1993 RepID=UPI0020272998|nr:metallophosphoesterase [Actinomadura madurae]MCP9947511.1 metallophosphoesterase [Actinomadura madurae]MCP9964278.1 metallophosphoesterase [Actinomadura madurae]MCP9976761.1 metallophosphoesterase [Actinomadura madurae]MCQ0012944.1 metallophosphoesterase [Actinomadura madurae]URM93177.1 metallophosphoesterase [Actinomadura madurae]
MGGVYAISDLHVGFSENRAFVEEMRPGSEDDWLIVAGDVAERFAEIEWALRTLRDRYATVLWAPGNHELWTIKDDPVQLRGEARYRGLVDLCRDLGVLTPEDPYPVWDGEGGPATIAPLFVLYDYTFRPEGTSTKEEALKVAHESGVVCTDEVYLHPDPHPTRDAWCDARIAYTERRLAELEPGTRTVLVNHWPLVREPTRVLWYPEFAQWCGTERTADWHARFGAVSVVYGHLHIPRTIWTGAVPHIEVSVGYPREWRQWAEAPRGPRRILPDPETGRPYPDFPSL